MMPAWVMYLWGTEDFECPDCGCPYQGLIVRHVAGVYTIRLTFGCYTGETYIGELSGALVFIRHLSRMYDFTDVQNSELEEFAMKVETHHLTLLEIAA